MFLISDVNIKDIQVTKQLTQLDGVDCMFRPLAVASHCTFSRVPLEKLYRINFIGK